MNYYENIFNRLNIQHIREFLLNGTECVEIDPKDYKDRIEEARKSIEDYFHEKYPDICEFEENIGIVFDYAGICEEVHMEIGLQCGFLLATQVLNTTQITIGKQP